jgi:cytochrome b6-f complex iron-sulfur subunit
MSTVRSDASSCPLGSCLGGFADARDTAGEQLTGIGRRTFLIQSAVLAAAAALAACGATGDATAPTLPASGNTIDVNSYPALNNIGGIAMVTFGSAPVAIVRTGASSFVALSRVCPHQGGIVNQSGSGFQCPVHGAQFTDTGQWVGGQRTTNLHAYTTSYDAATATLTVS